MKKEVDDLPPEPVECTACGHTFMTRSIRPTCGKCKKSAAIRWINSAKNQVDSS